jgi:UDP-glucose 4-epimerase
MRALVTGGAGFIGSNLVDVLHAQGHDVTVVDPATPADPFPKGVEHIEQTLQLAATRRSVIDAKGKRRPFDTVYHLAGPVGPVGVLERAGAIVPDIVEMAVILQRFTCPVVYVSTSEVYGLQAQPVDESRPAIIGATASARAEYAVGKLAGEMMLRNSYRMDVRVIRPFNVAGPRQMPGGGFVLPRFVEQALAGEPLTVYGDGTALRAFTHVYDIVDGIIRAGQSSQASGRVFNLGNNANACSILELAQEVAEVFGADIEFVDPKTLHGPGFAEAPDKTPSTAEAYSRLNWSPGLDRADVITDYIGWRLARG